MRNGEKFFSPLGTIIDSFTFLGSLEPKWFVNRGNRPGGEGGGGEERRDRRRFRVRCAACVAEEPPPPPLPLHPPPCFARSNPSDCQWPRRNSRCNETPFSTSPDYIIFAFFSRGFFSPTRVLELEFRGRGGRARGEGGIGWMISYQKGGGEGSTVIFFFILLRFY